METYTIIPVMTGEFQRADKSDFSYQKNAGTKLKAPIIMYVIRNDDTCILVDTGCSDEAWAERVSPSYRANGTYEAGAGAKRLRNRRTGR